MSKTTNPYEFLVRWDATTKQIKGCHVKMITTHIDDETGEIIAVKESDAMPVAWAQDNGFPLAQVLQAIQVDALATAQKSQADKAAMEKDIAVERDTLNTEKIAIKADKDALVEEMSNERKSLNADNEALSIEIESLKTTVSERDAEIESIKLNDKIPDIPAKP